MNDHIGRLQQALGAQGQKILGTRPGSDKGDRALFGAAGKCVEQIERLVPRRFGLGGQRGLDLRRVEELFVEAPPGRAVGQTCRNRLAQRTRQSGKRAKSRWQGSLDGGTRPSGNDRRGAFGGNGDTDRRTIDNGRRVEIALARPVDDIDRNTGGMGFRFGKRSVGAIIGDKDQSRIVEPAGTDQMVFESLLASIERQPATRKSVEARVEFACPDADIGARLERQPRLVERLDAATDDDDTPPGNLERHGKCVEQCHASAFRCSAKRIQKQGSSHNILILNSFYIPLHARTTERQQCVQCATRKNAPRIRFQEKHSYRCQEQPGRISPGARECATPTRRARHEP